MAHLDSLNQICMFNLKNGMIFAKWIKYFDKGFSDKSDNWKLKNAI